MRYLLILLIILASCGTSANQDVYFVTHTENIASLSGAYTQIYWNSMDNQITSEKAKIENYWYLISFDHKNRIVISGDWYSRDIQNGSEIIFK